MWPVKSAKDRQTNRPAVPIQMSKQQIMPQEDDKNCQGNQNINMWPVKPEMDMWLPKPAITRLCSDKNCQSTRCFKKRCPVRPMYVYDKNCQSANNMCFDKKPSEI